MTGSKDLFRSWLNLIAQLNERKIELISLKDAIGTSTELGRFFLNMFASPAEFERDIIRDRSKAGLSATRARARMGGKKMDIARKPLKQL